MPSSNMFVKEVNSESSDVQVIWAHGWMRDHSDFLPFVESLPFANHYVLDLPGFGKTPKPDDDWGTAEYATYMAEYLNSLPKNKTRIWVGHSFGCRVGMRVAAMYPELLNGLFLIAAPGLPYQYSLWKKVYIFLKIRTYKLLKPLKKLGVPESWYAKFFYTSDYRQSDKMRGIFIKAASENLSDTAVKIKCPTFFVYGEKDTASPASTGESYLKMIAKSKMLLLGDDHYTLLTTGRHQVLHSLKKFITEVNI